MFVPMELAGGQASSVVLGRLLSRVAEARMAEWERPTRQTGLEVPQPDGVLPMPTSHCLSPTEHCSYVGTSCSKGGGMA